MRGSAHAGRELSEHQGDRGGSLDPGGEKSWGNLGPDFGRHVGYPTLYTAVSAVPSSARLFNQLAALTARPRQAPAGEGPVRARPLSAPPPRAPRPVQAPQPREAHALRLAAPWVPWCRIPGRLGIVVYSKENECVPNDWDQEVITIVISIVIQFLSHTPYYNYKPGERDSERDWRNCTESGYQELIQPQA